MTVSTPLNVLIVEDEAVLAMELEHAIEDAGHAVAGWATCLSEANALIETGHADLALVDIHLADGTTGVEVAGRLSRETGATVVFMTANAKLIPDDFGGALGVIAKPYTTGGLQAVLKYLEQGITAPPPSLRQPSGLTLAPAYLDRWSR
jgi:DNA-binding response OmpR family regulator